MNKADARRVKRSILRCLTEDFTYGRRKDGQPLKRPKRNQRIFDAKQGHAVFNGTDLEMVMEAVVLGIYLSIDEGEGTP
jgi:hypothetical protein